MKALAVTVAVIATIVGALVVAYAIAYPDYTFRYRLTVEVEVDGQVKSESNVIEARWRTVPPWFPLGIGKDFTTNVFGEAVYVDLGARGPLIVTLYADDAQSRIRTSRSADRLALEAFGLSISASNLSMIGTRQDRASLRLDALPQLVTFSDVNNPATVRAVDPSDIEQIFGRDTKLRSVSVEITNAPITRSIREKLPWLRGMRPGAIVGRLSGGRHPNFYAISLIGDE